MLTNRCKLMKCDCMQKLIQQWRYRLSGLSGKTCADNYLCDIHMSAVIYQFTTTTLDVGHALVVWLHWCSRETDRIWPLKRFLSLFKKMSFFLLVGLNCVENPLSVPASEVQNECSFVWIKTAMVHFSKYFNGPVYHLLMSAHPLWKLDQVLMWYYKLQSIDNAIFLNPLSQACRI